MPNPKPVSNLPKDKSGQPKPGPGRPKGSFDRVRVIFEAIRKKIGDGTTEEAVIAWLSELDDKTLATLYGKAMPREIKAEVKGGMTWAEYVSGGADDDGTEVEGE